MRTILAIVAPSLATCTLLGGPPLDVLVHIQDGVIVTGSSVGDDPVMPVSDVHRVWGSALGVEDEQFPFTSTEPGFHALPGETTAGALFQFDFADAVSVWTGGGFAPTTATMLVQFGPSGAVTGDGPASGFPFGADGTGFMHVHLARTLLGPDGNNPAPGIYLLPLVLSGVKPPYAAAPTFWSLSNLGQSESELAAAMEWTDLHLACAIDRAGDGIVDGADLGAVLGAWGTVDHDLNGD